MTASRRAVDEPLWTREQMEAAFAARFAPARRPAAPPRRPASAAPKPLATTLPVGPALTAPDGAFDTAQSPQRQPIRRTAVGAQERRSLQKPLPRSPMRRHPSRSSCLAEVPSREPDAAPTESGTDSDTNPRRLPLAAAAPCRTGASSCSAGFRVRASEHETQPRHSRRGRPG